MMSLQRPKWLWTVLVSGALALVILAWDPHVRDLAAQTFRVELFQRTGFTIWNQAWYGGHYTLTYSALFPPLAAVLGARVVGALAVVASTYLFDRLVRERWGERAHWASLWFALGAATVLVSGQLTFALGMALGLLALRCLQLGSAPGALLAAALCPLASPLAAAFLGGIVIAGSLGRRVERRALPLATGGVAIAVLLAINLVFPDPGSEPFAISSFLAIPVWCAAVLLLTRQLPEERQFRQVVWAYLAASCLMLLVPNSLGGDAVRLGAVFGGPTLAAIVAARRPRAPTVAVVAVLAGSLGWQCASTARAVLLSSGDPSTQATYYAPLRGWLESHDGRAARIEVPMTANDWEAAYLAPTFSLARGWERQLDTVRNPIFYGDGFTSRRYGRWLRNNSVRYVALPDAQLDQSAERERALILRNPPYLRLRWSSAHWRVYEVKRPDPLVSGGAARLRALGASSFTLDARRPGAFVVRVRYTPYWRSPGACVEPAGRWTKVRVRQAGVVRVSTDFSLAGAISSIDGSQARCRA